MSITIEVDTTLKTAYIALSENDVARTVAHDELIQVDLDELGVAVGIEILDEGAILPFQDLIEKYHVHSDVVDLLRLIRPSVASYLEFTQGNDGAAVASGSGSLTPA